MPWLSAPVSQPSRRWRCSTAVTACSMVRACGPRSSGRRAVSHSASRPSDGPAQRPCVNSSPSSHTASITACSPSRLTKAATALMLRPSPSTARAVPRPVKAIATASAATTHQPRWRQRASSAGRPRRWPSSQPRSATCAARVVWVRKACCSAAWSSSGPAASMRCTASSTTAVASGVRSAVGAAASVMRCGGNAGDYRRAMGAIWMGANCYAINSYLRLCSMR